MRNIVRAVLIGLGAFFVVFGALLRFWAPGQAEKTPLSTNVTVVSEAKDAKILNPSTQKVETLNLRVTRTLKVDSAASTSKVRVVVETQCTVRIIGETPNCVDDQDPKGRLIQFATDRRAEDATSAIAVQDPKFAQSVNGKAVVHTGLGYKFPIHSKKQNYEFFDTTLLKAFPAVYKGTAKSGGITCYRWVVTIAGQHAPIVPGLVSTYDDVRDICADPVSGVVLEGSEHVVQKLPDGTTMIDATFRFTDQGKAVQLKLAKDARAKIQLMTVTVPTVCILLAIAAFVNAAILGARSSQAPERETENETVGVS